MLLDDRFRAAHLRLRPVLKDATRASFSPIRHFFEVLHVLGHALMLAGSLQHGVSHKLVLALRVLQGTPLQLISQLAVVLNRRELAWSPVLTLCLVLLPR